MLYTVLLLVFLGSCRNEVKKPEVKKSTSIVSSNGQVLFFPDTLTLSFFNTEEVSSSPVHADLTAIGKIGATVLASNTGALQNIVLFENPDLAGNYTQLIQHQINIRQIQHINLRQKEIELERIKELELHGVATGQDLLNAQTALSMEQSSLANEKAALIEHEAKLKSGGFDPGRLRNAKAGTAYIICDIPESQIGKIPVRSAGRTSDCRLTFSAFPNDLYTGKIEEVADMVDHATRMVKIRISVDNSSGKLKAGMFATVTFAIDTRFPDGQQGSFITISNTSSVTVQGKQYVFLKKSAHEFERKEIQTGQQIGDRLIVFSGLNQGDEIATEGVMQLKGLSFGY